jgi:uncharacterized lipoprotein YddW (UPF0748 family)
MCEACHITDIPFLAHQSSEKALWDSQMFNSSSLRFNGKPYLDYLVEQADARGMKVHAWLAIGTWPWMWGMLQTGTPGWKWSQANWLDMSRSDVQDAIGDTAAELAARVPGLAGVHLDYIRIPDGMSSPSITGADVTACVAAARAATEAAGVELTAAVVPHTFPGFDMAECRQPWNQWLDDNLLDVAMPMLYYSASIVEGQINHIENDVPRVKAGTVIGVAPASHQMIFRSAGDWEGILDVCVRREYDMAVFDDSWLRAEYQPGLQQRPRGEEPDRPVPKPPPVPAIDEARRWMWAQGPERLSVEGTREMLDMCQTCHATDILFLTHTSGQGALWDSTIFNSSNNRFDGVPYLDYLVEQAAARNMRVHGWLVVGTWPWIWGMRRDSTSDAWKWDQADWPDLSRADVQEAIGDAVAELCDRVPGLTGVHLDYLRIPEGMRNRGITEQHVTACVAAAKRATDAAGLELTAAVVPHTLPGKDMAEHAQPWTGWLDDSLVDRAMPTLYHDAPTIGEQIDHIEAESEAVRDRVVVGVAPLDFDGAFRSVAAWEAILDVCDARAYYIAVFDDTALGGEYKPALQQRPPIDKPAPIDEPRIPPALVEELLDLAERLSTQGQNLGGLTTSLSAVTAALAEAAADLEDMGSIQLPGLLPVTGDTSDDDV